MAITLCSTVHVEVHVPVIRRTGNWAWRPHPNMQADEYADNTADVIRVMAVYGPIVGRMMPRGMPRFRIVVTGALLGMQEWAQSTRTGLVIPISEPWCVHAA